jgi:hypothetical protein
LNIKTGKKMLNNEVISVYRSWIGEEYLLGLVRLFPKHMDWMGLKKNEKRFDLFGIQTHPIPLNPHGLRANRTSP